MRLQSLCFFIIVCLLLPSCRGCQKGQESATTGHNNDTQADSSTSTKPDEAALKISLDNLTDSLSGKRLRVVYSNDLRGNVEGTASRFRELGGLESRNQLMMQVLQRSTNIQQPLAIVDGGDALFGAASAPSESDKARAKAIAAALVSGGLDAMALGEYDLAGGVPFLQKLVAETKLPIVSSNIVAQSNPDKNLFIGSLLHENHGAKFGILSVTSPALLKNFQASLTQLGFAVESPLTTCRRLIPKLRQQGAEAIIVVAHLEWQEVLELLKQFADLGIVVAGHGQHQTLTPISANGNILVQTAGNGRYLGLLDLILRPQAANYYDATPAIDAQLKIMKFAKQMESMRAPNKRQPDVKELKVANIYARQIASLEEKVLATKKDLQSEAVGKNNVVVNKIITVETSHVPTAPKNFSKSH